MNDKVPICYQSQTKSKTGFTIINIRICLIFIIIIRIAVCLKLPLEHLTSIPYSHLNFEYNFRFPIYNHSDLSKMSRKFCVGGNWKMNGNKAEIADICKMLTAGPLDANTEVVIGSPSPYISYVRSLLPATISVAGQVLYILLHNHSPPVNSNKY